MPTPVGDLIDSVARRVRDDSNTAHTRAFVRNLFDRVQQVFNVNQESVLITRPITKTKNKTLYILETDLQGIIDVQNVRLNGKRLDQIKPWRDLYKLSATWLTDTAPQPEGWAAIGRTLVAVYPAPATDIELEFQGIALTTPLTDDAVPLQLELEDEDIVREIVTAMLLLRQRDLDVMQDIIARAAGKLGLQGLQSMDKPGSK